MTLLAREILDARQLRFELLEPMVQPDEPIGFLPADTDLLVHELHEAGVASQEHLLLVYELQLTADFSERLEAAARHRDVDPCYCRIKMSRQLVRA
jgi:hypothetical protein